MPKNKPSKKPYQPAGIDLEISEEPIEEGKYKVYSKSRHLNQELLHHFEITEPLFQIRRSRVKGSDGKDRRSLEILVTKENKDKFNKLRKLATILPGYFPHIDVRYYHYRFIRVFDQDDKIWYLHFSPKFVKSIQLNEAARKLTGDKTIKLFEDDPAYQCIVTSEENYQRWLNILATHLLYITLPEELSLKTLIKYLTIHGSKKGMNPSDKMLELAATARYDSQTLNLEERIKFWDITFKTDPNNPQQYIIDTGAIRNINHFFSKLMEQMKGYGVTLESCKLATYNSMMRITISGEDKKKLEDQIEKTIILEEGEIGPRRCLVPVKDKNDQIYLVIFRFCKGQRASIETLYSFYSKVRLTCNKSDDYAYMSISDYQQLIEDLRIRQAPQGKLYTLSQLHQLVTSYGHVIPQSMSKMLKGKDRFAPVSLEFFSQQMNSLPNSFMTTTTTTQTSTTQSVISLMPPEHSRVHLREVIKHMRELLQPHFTQFSEIEMRSEQPDYVINACIDAFEKLVRQEPITKLMTIDNPVSTAIIGNDLPVGLTSVEQQEITYVELYPNEIEKRTPSSYIQVKTDLQSAALIEGNILIGHLSFRYTHDNNEHVVPFLATSDEVYFVELNRQKHADPIFTNLLDEYSFSDEHEFLALGEFEAPCCYLIERRLNANFLFHDENPTSKRRPLTPEKETEFKKKRTNNGETIRLMNNSLSAFLSNKETAEWLTEVCSSSIGGPSPT